MSRNASPMRLRAWLRQRMPVPLAAPEPLALRQARLRIVAVLSLLGGICASWAPLGLQHQPAALPLVVGLVTFLLLQVPLWVRAKVSADDAWLLRERHQEEKADA